MNLTREQRESHTYTVHNADAAAPRTVIIEHSVRPEWKLASAVAKPEETSADFYRFRVDFQREVRSDRA